MNDITVPQTDRLVSPRAVLSLPGRRQPIIILKARGTQQEKFEEILAIEDPAYASQAMAIATLMTNAIDVTSGRFDSVQARKLILEFNAALPPADSPYKLATLNTYQSTVSQQDAVVSGMIDKLLQVLKTALGVALGQESIGQITAAITDAFTNLKSQEGDAWIFWKKKDQHNTVYSYTILFAIQDELTGRFMVAFPMSMEIEVDVSFEQVLWITIKDKHSYSVRVDAMKIAQLLFPKAPGSGALRQIGSAGGSGGAGHPGTQPDDRFMAISNIEVKNWSKSQIFATAAHGYLTQDGALVQLMAYDPIQIFPVYEEEKYLVQYTVGGHQRSAGMLLNAIMPDDTLWFTSI
ncbi:hypothetical protein [Rhizobium sp. SAFR-030]|uniref:hypothetical protein n=1 Tax=Rhizobium sp. SAFR-030 TaxID=3387277 RepID=UPI003F7FACE9